MGSRREEERNEKIIRGLMKLPPNRRCINCNSLGPQYVCTNFWTFICINCSGIHREFTHRVKSVSMAKFTSQEVEALQMGGNQRAKEIFLNGWDSQKQRLPDSSNVDKVRAFIKEVYVNKIYAGAKASEKPPRDMQSIRNYEDQTRRASSYHSYSQSPPYDYQYEDRRNRRPAAVLTRKPGSDRSLFERKISNFIYSPGHLSDQMSEDRFANEGSVSRVSDYSASSGGDPFWSATASPNLQDTGYSCPTTHPPGHTSTEHVQSQTLKSFSEANMRRDADGIRPPQRTLSLGSTGSIDSNAMSFKSANSGSFVSEPEHSAGINHDFKATFSSGPPSSVAGNFSGLDLFEAPCAKKYVTSSASSIDLFESPTPASVQSVDLFQSSQKSSGTSMHTSQPLHNASELLVPKNEGWATFDMPQQEVSSLGSGIITSTEAPSKDGNSLGHLDQNFPSNTIIQWPSSQSSGAHVSHVVSSLPISPWEGLHSVQDSARISNSWNAFEDSVGHCSLMSSQQSNDSQTSSKPTWASDYLDFKGPQDSLMDGFQSAVIDGALTDSQEVSHSHITGPSYATSVLPLMGGTSAHATERKSTNPFDLSYDSEAPSESFLNMSSLQSALPKAQTSSSFPGGVNQPWFPEIPVPPYVSPTQGGMTYMAGQTPASQLQGVPTQSPVASVGGNPFA